MPVSASYSCRISPAAVVVATWRSACRWRGEIAVTEAAAASSGTRKSLGDDPDVAIGVDLLGCGGLGASVFPVTCAVAGRVQTHMITRHQPMQRSSRPHRDAGAISQCDVSRNETPDVCRVYASYDRFTKLVYVNFLFLTSAGGDEMDQSCSGTGVF